MNTSNQPTGILLITIDSLRFDALNWRDKDRSSPIERLCDNGRLFKHAFATGPGTTPSFPALLTGTSPLSYGGLGPLKAGRPRVSEHMRQAGLATAGFHCNPFLSTHFNYNTGYSTFEDYQNPLMGLATKIFPRGIEISNPKLRRVDETLHLTDAIKKSYQLVKGKPRPYVSAEVITDDTLQWLSTVDEPFFCWTHYMDVHHPCFPPEQYRRQFNVKNVTQTEVDEWYSAVIKDPTALTHEQRDALLGLYRAAIVYVADQIARIFRQLEEDDRYDDTLIIVTSDHGELFGEHGQFNKPERMYDELLHVPLIVANGPDYLGDATDNLVSLLDIPPLIHDALGLDVPDEYEGRRPGIDDPREFVMAEHEVEGDVIVGARSRNWLYEGDEIRNEHRLFDLRDGKFERVSIETYAEETRSIRMAVNNRLKQLDIDVRRLEDEVEGDIESRLKDLGYL